MHHFAKVTCLVLFGTLFLQEAQAGGKKAPDPGPFTPNPLRKMTLPPVESLPFRLPNGRMVDLSVAMDEVLTTVVTETPNFQVVEPNEDAIDACGTHVELQASLSALVFNSQQYGISFGYGPEGIIGDIVKRITGTIEVKLGALEMDFHLYQCAMGDCTAVDAEGTNKIPWELRGAFDIDLDIVNVAPDLVYTSNVGKVIRKAMEHGVGELSTSNRLTELTWQARVREVDLEQGVVVFDAGVNDRIGENEAFVIYAPTPAGDFCQPYKAVAYVTTERVDTVSSVAKITRSLDAREVQVGDVVMVRRVSH